MLDSSGKVRDGFFDANLNSLGNQPQCMAVSVEKSKLLWNGTTVITNKFMYETFKSSMFANNIFSGMFSQPVYFTLVGPIMWFIHPWILMEMKRMGSRMFRMVFAFLLPV